jgi:hypothetical protein
MFRLRPRVNCERIYGGSTGRPSGALVRQTVAVIATIPGILLASLVAGLPPSADARCDWTSACPQLGPPFQAFLDCYFASPSSEELDIVLTVKCEITAAGGGQPAAIGGAILQTTDTSPATTTSSTTGTTASTASISTGVSVGTTGATTGSGAQTAASVSVLHGQLGATIKVNITIERAHPTKAAQGYGVVFDPHPIGTHWVGSNEMVGTIPATDSKAFGDLTLAVNETGPLGAKYVSFAYWDDNLSHPIQNGAIGFEAIKKAPGLGLAGMVVAVAAAMSFMAYRRRRIE